MNSRVKATAVVGSVLLLAVLIVLTVTLVAAAPRWQDPGADLELTKTADEYSPNAGESVEFTLMVTNTGTLTATNVVLQDFLPAGVTVESVSPSTGSCTTGTPGDPLAPLTCNLGEMPVGGTNVVDVTVGIDPDYVDGELPSDYRELENDALVYSDTFDPDNDNNRAHVILDVYTSSVVWMWKTGPDFATAGEEMSYHIRVRNLGPSTLRSFHFVDGLPLEVAYLGYEIEQGTGTCIYPWPMTGDHAAHCYLDDIAPGGVSIVHLRVVVSPDVPLGTVIWNYIGGWFADSYVDEVFGPPDWDQWGTEVTAGADLSIEKTSEPPKIFPGEQKVYHITVTNNGPSDAEYVVVSDTLPIELRYQIDTDNCAVVDGPPDLLRCELGTIPAGQNVQFDIHALVDPDYPIIQTVEITNTAEVWMETEEIWDPNWENNSDWTTNLILPPNAADLDLYKIHSCQGTCLAGNAVDFVLYVHNYGPLTAENVVLEDLLPEGVTVTGYQALRNGFLFDLSCNTGIPGDPDAPFTCGLGDVAVGDEVQVMIYTVIDPDYVHPIVPDDYRVMENDALVYSDLHDPNNDNNQTSALFHVYTMSDVYMNKIGPDRAFAGEEITYIIRARNDGPSTLSNFHFDDRLPFTGPPPPKPQVTYVGYDIPDGSGHCILTEQQIGLPLPIVRCWFDEIPPGDWQSVHLTVRVNPDVPHTTLIRNEITNSGADSYVDRVYGPLGWDWWETLVINQADLSVWKEADPYKVFAGEQVMYTIRVTNHGPGHAYEVDIHDELPDGVLAELVTDDACEIEGENGDYGEIVNCDWEVFPVGETKTFYIFARVEPDVEPGTVSNQVWVDADTSDPEDYNDYASAPILIQGKADLRVLKYGKPDGVVKAGDELTYTVIVDNLGPGYAHDVVLSDLFSSSSWAYYLDDWRTDLPADCYIDRHGRDTSIICELEYPLEVMSPEYPGRWVLKFYFELFEEQSVNNVADVVGADFDPDLSNNHAITEHEITAVADLDLEKEAWGEILIGCDGATDLASNEVAAGGMLTYTLEIYNEGPSEAENVVVEDWGLSPFLDIVDVDCEKDDWWRECSCNLSGLGELGDTNRHLVCYLGEIDRRDEDVITIRARIPSDVPEGTRLVNDARVYSDVFDDDNGDNLATNSTYVTVMADLGVKKSQEPETTLPGLEVVYTIRVDNWGPSDAHGVLISDTLPFTPTMMTVEGCASDGGQCDVPCEVPTCPAGECPWPDVDFVAQANIPAGEHVIYTLTAIPEWVPCEPITNTAEVGFAPGFDDIDPCNCEECDGKDFAYTVSDPECNFDPLVLKEYPGPDSPP